MTEKASAWGRQSKEIIATNAIQFCNRHGGKFDWDNDDLSKLQFTTELPNMIHPDMLANLPGIELESDFLRPAVPTSGKKLDIMTQLVAARLNAGLENDPEANIDPKGVIDTPDMSPRDDMDPGVSWGQGVLPTIEEEQEIITELSDHYDYDSDDNRVYDKDSVEDVQEPVIQKTRSGRVTLTPNNLEPRHGPGQ